MTTIPLFHAFKCFLEKDDILLKMVSNIEALKRSDRFINIVQGDFWQKKCALYPAKLLIPYFLYADDIEIDNALGSHSACQFYYSFPCLPINDTKQTNVFLAAVVKSKDLKEFGNEKCLAGLIDQLVVLEKEGVQISLSNSLSYNVHLIPALIIGHNLGLNSILGFNKSFNGLFCRFCTADRQLTKELCSERFGLLRNEAVRKKWFSV